MSNLFDFSLLSAAPFALFGVSFAAVAAAILLILAAKPAALRPAVLEQGSGPIYFVGPVLVAVIATIVHFVLGDDRLSAGLLLAAILTVLIGRADERRRLTALQQLFAQSIIAGIVVLFGWTIPYVTNLAGQGIQSLNWYGIGSVILPGSLVALAWLIFVMNAVNWLDGVDGQAGSVVAVAFLTLALVSLLPQTQDRTTLILAAIGAGATLAFLLWNLAPARVYLGTSGAWFIGLYVGMVAMVGGGKIATALLVLSLPALDAIFVIVDRIRHRRLPWHGDTERHFHHRLVQVGLPPRLVAPVSAAISAVAGVAALILQTRQKVWALGIAALLLAGISWFLASVAKRHRRTWTATPNRVQ